LSVFSSQFSVFSFQFSIVSFCEVVRVWEAFEIGCYLDWNYTWAGCFLLVFFLFSLMNPSTALRAGKKQKNQGLRIRLPLAALVGGDKISLFPAQK